MVTTSSTTLVSCAETVKPLAPSDVTIGVDSLADGGGAHAPQAVFDVKKEIPAKLTSGFNLTFWPHHNGG